MTDKTEKPEAQVFVTVVRKPTMETLRNIAHDLKLKNRALQKKLAAQLESEKRAEPFNPIRGLATIKVKP